MAIDFSTISAKFNINGIQVIDNATVTGIMNGTSREAQLSVVFIGSISGSRLEISVLDSNGKEADIEFDKINLTGRFLFNAGKTPNQWNKKMLDDHHLKVKTYFNKSSDACAWWGMNSECLIIGQYSAL